MKNTAWQKFKKDRWGIFALVVVLLFFCCAICVEIYDAYCRKNNIIQAYNVSTENLLRIDCLESNSSISLDLTCSSDDICKLIISLIYK